MVTSGFFWHSLQQRPNKEIKMHHIYREFNQVSKWFFSLRNTSVMHKNHFECTINSMKWFPSTWSCLAPVWYSLGTCLVPHNWHATSSSIDMLDIILIGTIKLDPKCAQNPLEPFLFIIVLISVPAFFIPTGVQIRAADSWASSVAQASLRSSKAELAHNITMLISSS